MTTVQYISIIFAIAIMVVGLYMIFRGIKKQKTTKIEAEQALIGEKNGIPIVPRHQRQLPEEQLVDESNGYQQAEPAQAVNETDTEHQQLERQAAHNAFEQANVQVIPDTMQTQAMPDTHVTNDTQVIDNSQSVADFDPDHLQQADGNLDIKYTAADECDDVFSSLASATEKLMPVIETAPEPDFEANSPMLDQHLLAEADHDQNSPLNHAQENINITLIPANEYETIDGKKILALVKQYGLKYGAMNMFHRYEHKDGSGILWFSMMGITEDGIAPFDLNMLPSSRYNGLVLFLSLPHPKAIQGFDSMMSVVNLISNDLNAVVLDENNQVLTREHRHQLRAQVQQYQAANQGL